MDDGCWVVYMYDMTTIVKAIFPKDQELEALRYAVTDSHHIKFVPWGELTI